MRISKLQEELLVTLLRYKELNLYKASSPAGPTARMLSDFLDRGWWNGQFICQRSLSLLCRDGYVSKVESYCIHYKDELRDPSYALTEEGRKKAEEIKRRMDRVLEIWGKILMGK